ncbi:MAG: ribosome small subunit-dependent GTPase A [Cytophagaceae bacterium]|nr:ribosome small subunit-dependent GTPase A [Cytophagaceae bacterium]
MLKGIITKSTGSWYDIAGEDQKKYLGRLRGKFKIKDLKVTNPIAVGDKVAFEPEPNLETVSITEIFPRENYIIRKSSHKTNQGHLIASNIDQSLLVVTLSSPKTSNGFIDRFLISCEAFRIPAILAFNKCDVYDEEEQELTEAWMDLYRQLGYTCLSVSAVRGDRMEQLRALLENKTTLISGHSGVGKSSLLNALLPSIQQKTSEISAFSDKGVHTTTFAEMFDLNDSTHVIDTPGIKELGIFDIGEAEISHYFPEMRALLGQCKFHNCTHVHEPKCAVLEAVKDGRISEIRYESYLSILANEDNRH